jgi:hypothetical protein
VREREEGGRGVYVIKLVISKGDVFNLVTYLNRTSVYWIGMLLWVCLQEQMPETHVVSKRSDCMLTMR